MKSTSSVEEVLNNTIGLPNRIKTSNIKPNRIPIVQKPQNVDLLLNDYSDLIDPNYTHWFGAKFRHMGFDIIQRAASQARADGKNPQKLFAHLIKKYS